MKTEHDLAIARGKIAAKITTLETELKYWRDELAAFDRVETTMRRLIAGENGENVICKDREGFAPSNFPRLPLVDLVPGGARRRGHLRKLVIQAVKSTKLPLSAKEVERVLLSSGYVPAGKHFDISIYKTLKRLAANKVIDASEKHGRLWFSAKSEKPIQGA